MLMTTVSSEADARAIAEGLVGRGLAACVQTLPIQSCYRWEGEVRNDSELLLLIKTSAARQEDVRAAIEAMHPYALPELLGLSIGFGAPAYLAWIAEQTGGGEGR